MPLFIAVHKWKPQDTIAIMKELVTGFAAITEGKAPKGVELCATYGTLGETVFCVWKAPSKADLEKTFDQSPILKKYTEFVPVYQVYPPTIEYVVALWQQSMKAASK